MFGQSGRRENTEKHKHTLFNFVARQHKISLLLPPTVFISSSLSDSTALSASESVVALQLRPGTFYTTKAMSPSAAPKAANHRVCVWWYVFERAVLLVPTSRLASLFYEPETKRERESEKKSRKVARELIERSGVREGRIPGLCRTAATFFARGPGLE